MGCVSSSWSRAKEFTERARKRSSVWASIDIDSINLNAEDWTNVFAVSNLIRSQGTDVDVVTNTFERLFSKIPKTKGIFIDAGIIIQLEESKGDPRFRAHIREIVGSLNRILELKSSDSDALEPYLREIREIHRRIKGFHFSYFEVFAHCYEHSFLNLVGPAVSRQQKDAYRKFIIHLVKLLCRDEDLTSASGAYKSRKKRLKSEKDMQDATQDRKSLQQADKKHSGTHHRKLKARKQEEEQTVSTEDEQEAGDEAKPEISKADERKADDSSIMKT